MLLNIFSRVCWPSVCLFGGNVYLDLLPIFKLGCLFFDIKLYKLFVYFRNYALVGHIICKCFLPFFKVSFCFFFSFVSFGMFLFCFVFFFFCCAKILSLMRSHLFIFAFVCITLEDGAKKILLKFTSCQRGFWLCPVFPAPLVKEIIFFSIVYSCLLCHSLIEYRYVGLFLGFPVPLICISIFCASIIVLSLLWLCNIV